jgi:hypothetical protein
MQLPEAMASPTIGDLLQSFFPKGTNGQLGTRTNPRNSKADDSIATAPTWLPDLFACMALLLARSGAYTHPAFFFSDNSVAAGMVKRPSSDRNSRRDGADRVEARIRSLWTIILKNRNEDYVDDDTTLMKQPPKWAIAACELLQIADLACAEFGILTKPSLRQIGGPVEAVYSSLQIAYAREHEHRPQRLAGVAEMELDFQRVADIFRRTAPSKEAGSLLLPYVPASLCIHVPPYVACVQPKAMTPQLGQTIRSFSHNLALLPAQEQVTTHWYNTFRDEKTGPNQGGPRGLNLLLVPYPYQIDVRAFQKSKVGVTSMFRVDPNVWLADLGNEFVDQADNVYAGLDAMIAAAQIEVGRLDGIIMPEMSITHGVAEKVSEWLFEKYSDIHFFVAGISSERLAESIRKGESSDKRPVNGVYTRVRMEWYNAREQWKDSQSIAFRRLQMKHHRWRLNAEQIKRYNLSSQLAVDTVDPANQNEPEWWEDTDVVNRECLFWVIGHKYVVSTIICEDLARIEPVQEVLRAVGPNLIIAILLDGPQLPHRWAARYATGFCDDPGSSVLTLTSLGMLRRMQHVDTPECRVVGLWKDSFGVTRELQLPPQAAGLVLSMCEERMSERTLMGRSQSKAEESRKLSISGVRPVFVSQGGGKNMFRRL